MNNEKQEPSLKLNRNWIDSGQFEDFIRISYAKDQAYDFTDVPQLNDHLNSLCIYQ